MYTRQFVKLAKSDLVLFISLLVIMCVCVMYNSNYFNQYSLIIQHDNNMTENRLVDLKNFEFLINPQNSCDECKDGFLLTILVHTSLLNVAKRIAIRETWGKPSDCVKVLFFMGATTDNNLTQTIRKENDKYHDIVQGNFMDTYRNLTYKHVMVLKWATEFCEQAKYIVKTDDDIMVHTNVLYGFLKKDYWGASDLIACTVKYNTTVFRSNSRWSVTTDEYSEDRYPDYCLGPFVIYSADVVHRLLEQSYNTPYFWIDDVHVTGILAKKIGIKNHVSLLEKWYLYNTHALFEKGPTSVKPFIYGPLEQKPDNIYKIWKTLGKEDRNETRQS